MKKFYKSNNLRRLSLVLVLFFSVLAVVTSCKEEREDEFKDRLVRFEAKITQGTPATNISVFKTVVTQVGTVQNTIFDPTGSTWSSAEFFVNESQSQLNLDVNAMLLNANSELTATIYVDGEAARTETVKGAGVKSISLDFSFLDL
ncbi:hypothetical protein ASG01_09135 [Chryseobacterium sp. Leaf180]|jgi:hypothetical protein|uniref:hypothetical protein n=1 Tax=Chryseobacterium sp. Leaf180 TaxID=1736289 RepID=UPI000701BE26|nr:hypothetical protein [Chryseobacterium sp. Leaf180]KQR93348.1 hypothetical protein ASG01_09135 [Chryseobacterium sp. Leaf180]